MTQKIGILSGTHRSRHDPAFAPAALTCAESAPKADLFGLTVPL